VAYEKDNLPLKSALDPPEAYRQNLERGLVIALLFFILLVYISPHVRVSREEAIVPNIIISVENVPVTRQALRKPPPPRPKIPVPSDDETIPEEVTIEETTLKNTYFFSDNTDGIPVLAGTTRIPAKPIGWTFPKFPEEDKKKGVHGDVKLSILVDSLGKVTEVEVLENSTGSARCAQAAVEAAYGNRFIPAREGNKVVSSWVIKIYSFDVGK
jgi:protein TonB